MMFVDERERIQVGGSDIPLRKGCVQKSGFVVDERKHIRARILFQRGEKYLFSAAESGKGIDHESRARFRFHPGYSRPIPQSFAMRIILRVPILFLSMKSAAPHRLNIVS